jgi:hypothetical protein
MKKFYRSIVIFALISVGISSCLQNNSETEKNTRSTDSLSQGDSVGNYDSQSQSFVNSEEIKFKKYCSSKFGFCVDYPEGILFPQGESDNGDGQMFKSKNAENYLQVYRDYRDMVEENAKFSLEDAYQLDTWSNDPDKPKRVLTYKKLGKNFYVVSGYNNSKVFYQKTIIINDVLATCMLEYNEAEKSIYDKVCDRIYKSFK